MNESNPGHEYSTDLTIYILSANELRRKKIMLIGRIRIF